MSLQRRYMQKEILNYGKMLHPSYCVTILPCRIHEFRVSSLQVVGKNATITVVEKTTPEKRCRLPVASNHESMLKNNANHYETIPLDGG